MATRTISATGGNWSSTLSWSEGAVPTSADDVVATGLSANLTLDTTGNCRSVDFTNYTGTFTMGSNVLNVGTSTVNGTTAFKAVAGMTLAFNSAALLNFVSTSGTQIGITTAGKTMPTITFNGLGGSWKLLDTFTGHGTCIFTLTQGSLDTNGQTVTVNTFFISGSGTRSLTLGASSITCTLNAAGGWDATTVTNLTFSGASSTITLSGSSASFRTGGLAYGAIVLSGSGTAVCAGCTCTAFTRTGTASTTEALNISGTITCSGLVTLSGTSPLNQLLVFSSTLGTTRTFSAASVSLTNVDFQDITGAGAAAPWTGTRLGDCGGNAGITFDTPRTLFWVGNGGSWDSTAHWSTSTGGASGSSPPLPQDDVRFDANSFSSGAQTVTSNMVRFGNNVDWTGVTNNPTWTSPITTGTGANAPGTNAMRGALTLAAGMTRGSFSSGMSFYGRDATYNLTFASKGMPGLNIVGKNATYRMSDAISGTSGALSIVTGTFDGNGFNHSVITFTMTTTGNVCGLALGGGLLTLTGTGLVWQMSNTANFTLTGTPSVRLSDVSATTKSLNHFKNAAVDFALTGGGTGSVTFNTNGTGLIGTLTIGAPKTVLFQISLTHAVATLIANGTAANNITINSTTAGTAATLSLTNRVEAVFASIKDIAAINAQFLAIDSTDVSGNSGITFLPPNLPTMHEGRVPQRERLVGAKQRAGSW